MITKDFVNKVIHIAEEYASTTISEVETVNKLCTLVAEFLRVDDGDGFA